MLKRKEHLASPGIMPLIPTRVVHGLEKTCAQKKRVIWFSCGIARTRARKVRLGSRGLVTSTRLRDALFDSRDTKFVKGNIPIVHEK